MSTSAARGRPAVDNSRRPHEPMHARDRLCTQPRPGTQDHGGSPAEVDNSAAFPGCTPMDPEPEPKDPVRHTLPFLRTTAVSEPEPSRLRQGKAQAMTNREEDFVQKSGHQPEILRLKRSLKAAASRLPPKPASVEESVTTVAKTAGRPWKCTMCGKERIAADNGSCPICAYAKDFQLQEAKTAGRPWKCATCGKDRIAAENGSCPICAAVKKVVLLEVEQEQVLKSNGLCITLKLPKRADAQLPNGEDAIAVQLLERSGRCGAGYVEELFASVECLEPEVEHLVSQSVPRGAYERARVKEAKVRAKYAQRQSQQMEGGVRVEQLAANPQILQMRPHGAKFTTTCDITFDISRQTQNIHEASVLIILRKKGVQSGSPLSQDTSSPWEPLTEGELVTVTNNSVTISVLSFSWFSCQVVKARDAASYLANVLRALPTQQLLSVATFIADCITIATAIGAGTTALPFMVPLCVGAGTAVASAVARRVLAAESALEGGEQWLTAQILSLAQSLALQARRAQLEGCVPMSQSWALDEHEPYCQRCNNEFGFGVGPNSWRRHHCRSCGRLICSDCLAGIQELVRWVSSTHGHLISWLGQDGYIKRGNLDDWIKWRKGVADADLVLTKPKKVCVECWFPELP